MKTFSLASVIFALLVTISSCSNSYYSKDDFRKVKKIDTHVHLNSENNALTEQAVLDNFALLAVNVDVPSYPSLEKQFEYSNIQKKQFPNKVDNLTAFTLEKWNSPNWAEKTIDKLKTDFANGALGIKIWKNIGMTYKDSADHFIMIDDPKFDSVIAFIIQNDKTVMAHLGEPKNCWLPVEKMTVNNDKNYFKNHPEYYMFLHPDYPSYETQIKVRDNFIERHPKMRFVGAHLGSLEWSVDELAKRLDKYPNMAVDMAARIGHIQYQSQKHYEKIRQFFIQYQDRLIYATDSHIDSESDPSKSKNNLHHTWTEDWRYFTTDEKMTNSVVDGEFSGLKLPKEVIDKIFHHNAVRWFKIKD